VYSQKQQRSRVRVLEDKLADLERRLDEERQANAGPGPGTGSESGSASGSGPGAPAQVLHAQAPGPLSTSPNVLAPPVWSATVSDTASTSSPVYPHPTHFAEGIAAPSAGVELFLGLGPDAFALADLQFGNKREPDLMTLADAAAGDANMAYPWEGMSPSVIASELYKAVFENNKGSVGEKIIAHL
jgi:hypothetical protein